MNKQESASSKVGNRRGMVMDQAALQLRRGALVVEAPSKVLRLAKLLQFQTILRIQSK